MKFVRCLLFEWPEKWVTKYNLVFSYSFLLILVLFTKAVYAQKERCNLIYLQMFEFMQKFFSVFPEIKSLSVFNDKNHLNALFVEAKNEVSTLVHQHGYTANKASYFPINANHFLSCILAYDYARNYRQQGRQLNLKDPTPIYEKLETKFQPRVKCFKILIVKIISQNR